MTKDFLKRRGETAPSNAAAALLSTRWHGFRVARAQGRGRIGLICMMVLCIYGCKSLWNSNQDTNASSFVKHEGRLVVALSTIPSRIHLLQPTLESLIHQDLPPDTIYLTLAKKKAHSNILLNYTLPNFLQHYQSSGKVQILTPEYDYGSIMKVFHVLQIEDPDTRIVYVDDDWIYPSNLLETLYNKSLEYPNNALCLSGGMLRTHFRQIGHTNLQHNHYPYVFMEISGTPTLLGGKDHAVDIAQGFCGVLVKPKFVHVDKLMQLLQQPSLPVGVVKSDDFILSSHLEHCNISRILVDGGTLPQLTEAAGIDKLSLYMYRNAIQAAHYLQQYWNIWRDYKFYDPILLSKQEWDAIDCEAGRGSRCDGYQQVLRELETKYPPS